MAPGEARPARYGTGSAERVRAFLAEHGMAARVVTFERSTKTAQMAAEAIGCELGQIVKSLVFVASDRPVVALVAGDRRGDGEAIAAAVGTDGPATFADAQTVRDATGYSIGGVSPFDLPPEVTVLVDDALTRYEKVFPAAGTPNAMLAMTLDELLDLSGGRLARISHVVAA